MMGCGICPPRAGDRWDGWLAGAAATMREVLQHLLFLLRRTDLADHTSDRHRNSEGVVLMRVDL